MKCALVLILLLITVFNIVISSPLDKSTTLVVSTTEVTTKETHNEEPEVIPVNPQIYSMEIRTNISNRFATTLITSKVRNVKNEAAESTFSVILPENAFIAEFLMEIDGKVYKAYVKEKEEAKKIYQQAVSAGRSAAHVELSARDSKTFTVSVNIEPESKTIFRLTYEELLQRQLGQYELVVNIHPGQVVDDLNVKVYINESRPLTFVNTPSLRTGNEISKNEENLTPSTDIEIINSTSAVVKFRPDKEQQKKFADLLGSNKENGFAGQFVVQYDVERDPKGGEVLIRDGYFVHFFSPSDLEPLPKQVIFVLDHSGSMEGRKMEQLTEAMKNILSDLNNDDVFSIIRFSRSASIWNITENKFSTINLHSTNYGHLEPELRELNLPDSVEATSENVQKAKKVIEDTGDMGLTNIIEGLETALFLIKRTQEKFQNEYHPMIIFLTDGLPNVGMSSTAQIIETVTKLNSGFRASIFSLSFGVGADKEFLQKLSSKNLGFSRHIYEAADASLQLQDFYRKISSPLLSNVTFKYVDGVTDVTKSNHPLLFNGSELVVAGKTNNIVDVAMEVQGNCRTGPVRFTPVKEKPVSSLERLWAYLTVKQLLKERETATNGQELAKRALDLALKYSFVTEVTSLVVVKPNQTESIDGQTELQKPIGAPSRTYSSYRPPQSGRHLYALRSRASGRSGIYSFSGSSSGPYFPRFGYSSITPLKAPTYSMSSQSSLEILPERSVYMTARTTRRPKYNLTPSTTPSPSTTIVDTTYIPTTLPPLKTTGTTDILTTPLPVWLENLQTNNQNITTPQGSFMLGKSGDVVSNPSCPRTPFNGTTEGKCKIIFDCPQIYPLLTDFNAYLQYFCPLNEYAGVCCPPNKSASTVS